MAYDIKHGTNKTLFLSFLIYFDRLLTYNIYFIRTSTLGLPSHVYDVFLQIIIFLDCLLNILR